MSPRNLFKMFCVSCLKLVGWKLYIALTLFDIIYKIVDHTLIIPLTKEKKRKEIHKIRLQKRINMYHAVQDIASTKGLAEAIKLMYKDKKE